MHQHAGHRQHSLRLRYFRGATLDSECVDFMSEVPRTLGIRQLETCFDRTKGDPGSLMGQAESATDKLWAKSAGPSAPSCALESRDNVRSPLTHGTFAHNIYKNDAST